jgi:hypothetical protein
VAEVPTHASLHAAIHLRMVRNFLGYRRVSA